LPALRRVDAHPRGACRHFPFRERAVAPDPAMRDEDVDLARRRSSCKTWP